MNEAELDQIISDAQPKEADAKAPTPEVTETEEKVEAEVAKDTDGDNNVPFPKKAVNAIQRRDRQLNKLRAEKMERDQKFEDEKYLESRLSEIKAKKAPTAQDPNDPEPDINKYTDFTKYQDDRQDWRLRQREKQTSASQQDTQTSTQQTAWRAEREKHMDTQANEILTKNPDLMNVVHENADILSGFAQPIKDAFLKADNAILAIAVLAQEGTLEDLSDMSPALAEKTIKRAAERGMAFVTQEEEEEPMEPVRVSSAPIPMAPSRSSQGSKKGKDMPDKEFRKTYL